MKSQSAGRFTRPSDIPPLRADPFKPDVHDGDRCRWVKDALWGSQDVLLRPRDRQVEENIRMLHGQHWIVWSKLKGQFVNLAELIPDNEQRWRHMPVMNRLINWFVLNHARMTENPPVISWQPGPDRIDALLAEVCDPIYKYLWQDIGMLEVLDRALAWMIPSGRVYAKSRIDPTKGDLIPMRGPAMLELLGADGQPIRRQLDNVPFARNASTGDFEPAAQLEYDEEAQDYVPKPLPGVRPETLYEGGIEVDVLTCLEARGEWGQQIPWHKKGWHIQKSLLTPLQAWEAFGVELEPDVTGSDAENNGAMWRILQGTGLFGAADGRRSSQDAAGHEFCSIYEAWFRPSRFPGTQRTQDSPGGRLLIVTGGGKVIRDGVRPAPFRYTSPIRCFDFVNLPGRSQGSSPQEFMNGPIRTRNRLTAQHLAHATLAANPIRVGDRSQGIEEGMIPNTPGAEVIADRSGGKSMPIEYVNVPNIGSDVMNAADRLKQEADEIGQLPGSEGSPPTSDASGELVKELRFNSDRPIAAPMKRMVTELARMAEDWIALVPTIWDREKVISVAGEDNIARTIIVYPDLFKDASVNATPEIESMLPDGRGERQERAFLFWQKGVWGDPASPQARAAFLDMARFPHMGRLTRPGGSDRATAEQNVGAILQGVPAAKIELFPWYDFGLHIYVLEQFLKAPEYKKQSPEIKAQFLQFWNDLNGARAEAMLLMRHRQQEIETGAAASQLRATAELGPLANAVSPTPPITQGPPDQGPTAQLPAATTAA